MPRSTFESALRAATSRMQADVRAQRYKTDPVLWAEEQLGVILWSKQKEILRSIVTHKRTAVKSCHSIGKTFTSAIAACWWISTRDDTMVQSTAPTYDQVHSLLWEEIRKMHARANLIGRITLGDDWLKPYAVKGSRSKDRKVGEGKKPADTNIHGFQGTHRPDGVLAILDEACGLATSIYTGAEAINTASFDRILAVGNPDDPNTEFGSIFLQPTGEWNLITVSAFQTPNFTEEGEQLRAWAAEADKGTGETTYRDKVEAMLDGLPQHDWVESRARAWGKDSARYTSKVLAEFPKTSQDSLFSASEIEKAFAEKIEPTKNGFRVLGADIARYGEDKTVVALNVEGHIDIVGVYATMDTMEAAANIHKLAMELNVDQVRVDGIGPGGGVVDRLITLSAAAGKPYVVVEMTASARPPDPTLHRNARAYWYDSLKHQMGNARIDLPKEDGENDEHSKQLRRELGGVKYTYKGGVLQLEAKEDIRKRGGKSPDFVDAVVMATAPIGYVAEDPLAGARVGQVHELDVLDDIEMVSLY